MRSDITKRYIFNRKRIYASINGRKGNLITLKKSCFLNKDEKSQLENVIKEMEKLRIIYNNNNNNNNYLKHRK